MRQIARDSNQFNEPITIDRSPDGEVAVVEVPLAGTGNDDTSMAAVDTLRQAVLKLLPSVSGGQLVGVTGFSAGSSDFNGLMASRIWYVFAFVFATAFVLLLVTFRLVVIPIKAIALNILVGGRGHGHRHLGLPGREPREFELRVHRRDQRLVPADAVRDPVRPLDGLPRRS